jgi:hypothetical protein
MNLELGAHDADVCHAQQQMNKLGCLLDVDGNFGRSCEAAVRYCRAQLNLIDSAAYDTELDRQLVSLPAPMPGVALEAISFIAREEIGDMATYERRWCAPCFPGGESGVTIGVGYDLRFQKDNFEADWKELLPASAYQQLSATLGKQGDAAAVNRLSNVRISWPAAWRVFTQSTLPKTLALVQASFPGQEALSDLSRGALVSLVYNRGASFDGDRRAEMRSIRSVIAAGHSDQAPEFFLSMRRLWPDASGLRARREREAELFKAGLAS